MKDSVPVKAVVCTRYGPPEVLQIQEVEKPVPADDEVLIHVRAASVMAGDCELRSCDVSLLWKILLRVGFGIRRPRRKVLGQDLSGVVEEVGGSVSRFRVGDEVFANTGLRLGAYAEYACLREGGLIEGKPRNLTFEEAAGMPAAGLYVIPLMKRAGIESGQRVMIVGAGGTMGTVAVQYAKSLGADITAVDRGKKLDMLRSIGAVEVWDCAKGDPPGKGYDVIADLVGKGSVPRYMSALKEPGVLLLGNPGIGQFVRGRLASRGAKKVISTIGSYPKGALAELRSLVEAGKIRSVIDRKYTLDQTAEAHRYVDTGEKSGNVIITV